MSAADQIYNAVSNHRHRNTGNDGTGDTQCTRSRPRAQNPRTTSYRNASDAARGSASGRGLAHTTNAAPSRWHGAGRSGTWSREHSLPPRPKQPPRFEAHCHTTPLRACCWRRPPPPRPVHVLGTRCGLTSGKKLCPAQSDPLSQNKYQNLCRYSIWTECHQIHWCMMVEQNQM